MECLYASDAKAFKVLSDFVVHSENILYVFKALADFEDMMLILFFS